MKHLAATGINVCSGTFPPGTQCPGMQITPSSDGCYLILLFKSQINEFLFPTEIQVNMFLSDLDEIEYFR